MAQIFVSVVAHFFMSVGGSEIHERLAHFFVDIYTTMFAYLTDKFKLKKYKKAAATQITVAEIISNHFFITNTSI